MEALGGFGERRFAMESLSSKLCMKPFKVRPTGDFIVLKCHISISSGSISLNRFTENTPYADTTTTPSTTWIVQCDLNVSLNLYCTVPRGHNVMVCRMHTTSY